MLKSGSVGLGNEQLQKALGNKYKKVQTFIFNAGPSAIEALLAKRIDVIYVGFNPAVNGMWYLKENISELFQVHLAEGQFL